MSEWISREDRMPVEEDGLIWIYYGDIEQVSSMVWDWDSIDPSDPDDDCITHFMPTGLRPPEPPK